jgi:uncharacterized protein (DUF1800 family)
MNTLSPQQKARIAFQRFGLGPRPGGPAAMGFLPNSARDACLAELENPAAALIDDAVVPSYKDACAVILLNVSPVNVRWTRSQEFLAQELTARFAKQILAPVGFLERLVMFWTNHFSTNRNKSDYQRAISGHFERTAIRKNVLGTFPDMITAVYQHPAMIEYLDNGLSFGKYSDYGRRETVSYNENLARECLELHTVGSEAGYTQEDVRSVSKILTGWSMVSRSQAEQRKWDGSPDNAGQFIFRAGGHEYPYDFTVLGKTYPASFQQQGFDMLRDLALHPATAEHIAFKLVRHFVMDRPPPAMVDTLAKVYLDTGGDLKALAVALIGLDDAWLTPLRRVKTPQVWMIGALRATGRTVLSSSNLQTVNDILASLNHVPWGYITPDGFPDEDFAWMNADALRMREEAANHFASNVYLLSGTAAQLASDLFPGVLSKASYSAVNSWKDYQRAMTVLLMTPEFQRR